MIRRLFPILAGVSILIAFAVVAMWVLSYFQPITVSQSDPIFRARPISGKVFIFWGRFSATHFGNQTPGVTGSITQYSVTLHPTGWTVSDWYAFHVQTMPPPWPPIRLIVFPIWVLLLPSLVLPAAWLRRRRRRVGPQACLGCGYDLRASRANCPECGRAIPAAQAEDATPAG